jgi:hypothetical protein
VAPLLAVPAAPEAEGLAAVLAEGALAVGGVLPLPLLLPLPTALLSLLLLPVAQGLAVGVDPLPLGAGLLLPHALAVQLRKEGLARAVLLAPRLALPVAL